MKNYYQTLGVDQNSTFEQIKSAYKEHVKRFHPDKQAGDKFFEEKFKEVQEAYEVLSDLYKRQAYDIKLKLSKSQSPNFNKTYEDLKREFEEELKKREEEIKRKYQTPEQKAEEERHKRQELLDKEIQQIKYSIDLKTNKLKTLVTESEILKREINELQKKLSKLGQPINDNSSLKDGFFEFEYKTIYEDGTFKEKLLNKDKIRLEFIPLFSLKNSHSISYFSNNLHKSQYIWTEYKFDSSENSHKVFYTMQGSTANLILTVNMAGQLIKLSHYLRIFGNLRLIKEYFN